VGFLILPTLICPEMSWDQSFHLDFSTSPLPSAAAPKGKEKWDANSISPAHP
jgi:hypothetical protein